MSMRFRNAAVTTALAVGSFAAAPAVSYAGPASAGSAAAVGSSMSLPGNTPAILNQARDVGAVDPTQTVGVTLWLKLRNENALTRQLADQYSPHSSTYHQWIDQAQFDTAYAPTAGQVTAVTDFLRSQGLRVDAVADNNLSVDASGSLAALQKAFHVQVDNYAYDGRTYRSNTSDPSIGDAGSASIVAAVTGLSNFDQVQAGPLGIGSSGPDPLEAQPGDVFHQTCGGLATTKTFPFTDATSATLQGFLPCDGYNAAQLQKAYGVDQLIAGGVDGTGQTVGIVDAFGSPTLLTDANRFSTVNGLPQLGSDNLQVISAPRPFDQPAKESDERLGWAGETTLDVEAAHAMAPGARIVVVASAENRGDTLLEALNFAIVHHVANIISNSWGLPIDLYSPNAIRENERVFMQAAAEGIDLNFASGDYGDNTSVILGGGTPVYLPKNVTYPAGSPWVSAVGGTSLFLNSDGSYKLETGWGASVTRLASCAQATAPGPDGLKDCTLWDNSTAADIGFIDGSGGGLADTLTAQPWQSTAIGSTSAIGFGPVGTHRAVPDIAMVGDTRTGMGTYWTNPQTGAVTLWTFGGTSLSSPLFAGILALVDQQRSALGKPPTGLATQLLYQLPANAVHDTLPTQPVNPAPSQPGQYLLHYTGTFSGSLYEVTMDSDTSLNTSPGWDDVTGLGTPNASFVTALASA